MEFLTPDSQCTIRAKFIDSPAADALSASTVATLRVNVQGAYTEICTFRMIIKGSKRWHDIRDLPPQRTFMWASVNSNRTDNNFDEAVLTVIA